MINILSDKNHGVGENKRPAHVVLHTASAAEHLTAAGNNTNTAAGTVQAVTPNAL